MASKLHNNKNNETTIKPNAKREHFSDDEVYVGEVTYWRSKNPKISKAKYKDIILTNRYDFGKDAPRRFKNFAWLRRDRKPKDYFDVGIKEK